MATNNSADFRKKRMELLFDECQNSVIANIIGPFGLSLAMFQDKDGGNVTTLHNFERDDEQFLATESDRALHKHSKSSYVRDRYSLSQTKWKEKRGAHIKSGVDGYTGSLLQPDNPGSIGNSPSPELDHVVSLSSAHHDAKNHLALAQVDEDGAVDVTAIREMMNHDDNLVITSKSVNASKYDHDLLQWADKKRADGSNNTEHYGLDEKRLEQAQRKAEQYISKTSNKALILKQGTELMTTGGDQAVQMGLRQAMGLLLTELANSLFNEIKELVKYGAQAGQTWIEDLIMRFKRTAQRVASRFKDALKDFFSGGISGFMSNLLTFLINNLISTTRNFVRMIREGMLGLYKALKLLFFPPSDMTYREALQAGLKILSATITVSAGILIEESLAVFLSTFPALAPISRILTSVLIGTLTGILTALLAYRIDIFFHGLTEKKLDDLMINEKLRNQLAHALSESLLIIRQDQINIENRKAQISHSNSSIDKNLDALDGLLAKIKE